MSITSCQCSQSDSSLFTTSAPAVLPRAPAREVRETLREARGSGEAPPVSILVVSRARAETPETTCSPRCPPRARGERRRRGGRPSFALSSPAQLSSTPRRRLHAERTRRPSAQRGERRARASPSRGLRVRRAPNPTMARARRWKTTTPSPRSPSRRLSTLINAFAFPGARAGGPSRSLRDSLASPCTRARHRTRSAHDTKRLFRRFRSTTSSTSALALYPIRTFVDFTFSETRSHTMNVTKLLTYMYRRAKSKVSFVHLKVRSVSMPFLSENVHIRWPSAPETARRARAFPRRCPARTSARRARAARRPLRTSRRRRRPARETRHAPRMPPARSPRSRKRLARAKAEVAALAARVRGHDPSAISGGVSFAPSDPRVIAAPLDASGARVYDRDRLGSHGTLSRRGDSWWFFDTHPEFVRETLASDAAVMRCPHLIGNRPTRAPHAIVTERRADDGTGAARFLRETIRRRARDSTPRALRCDAPRTAASAGSDWRSNARALRGGVPRVR